MASVTNLLTRIHDAEGTLTTGNIPTGGAGATANTDIFLQGSQSLGRRQTNTSDTGGFALVDGADNDCSASGTHVGMWIWVTHYGILDDLRVSLSTGTTPSSNYDYHTVPISEYPKLGGWKRVWVHVNRTPSGTVGAGLTESQVRCYGVQVSFTAAPGGNAQNLILDAADYVTGVGLRLTGTTGLWSDFTTADENSTNQYGIIRTVGGVYNLLGRVELGSSGSSLVFDDSNFTIIFPIQSLVQSTWMGVNVDLQNASTDINWSSGVIKSAGTADADNKGDLVVTGTSGIFTCNGMTFSSLRIITLTSACTIEASSFSGCGQITGAGATFLNNAVSGYTGASDTSAFVWNVNTDLDGYIDGCTFTKGTTSTHAIELGTSSPTTLTLTDVNFVGYNASNGQTDSAIHVKRTTGTVTINIVGGTTPSYKSDGATVVIVSGVVSVSVNVKSAATGANIQNARVFIETSDGTGPFPYQESVTITRSGSTATVTHTTHGLSTNDKVVIRGANENDYNGIQQITVTGTDTYTYDLGGKTPATPATGTIISSFVALEGLTDANGNITTSRSYASSQPIKGVVRKSTSAPYYKSAGVLGTVSNTSGFSANIQLISDD